MQKLCARCVKSNTWCLSSKKKKRFESVTILSNDLGDDYYITKHNYTTKSGLEIPSNVCVIEWQAHTYGMLNLNETPISIPVISDNNHELYQMLICIPDYILKN